MAASSIAALRDGTSNTALACELSLPSGVESDMRGVMHYPEGPFYHHNYTPNSPVPDLNRANECHNVRGAPCVEQYPNAWSRDMLYTARSRHPGGVNLLLGDGSVRFTGGEVIDGGYRLTGEASPTPGEKIVRISATRKTGRMVPAVPEPGTDLMIEEIKPYIPANYNHQSMLRCTVSKENTRHDFELVSRPEEYLPNFRRWYSSRSA